MFDGKLSFVKRKFKNRQLTYPTITYTYFIKISCSKHRFRNAHKNAMQCCLKWLLKSILTNSLFIWEYSSCNSSYPIASSLKMTIQASFSFMVVVCKNFLKKNCRLQRDSNSDRQNRRQASWPYWLICKGTSPDRGRFVVNFFGHIGATILTPRVERPTLDQCDQNGQIIVVWATF